MSLPFLIITLTSSFCTMSYSMLMSSVMMDFTGEEVITQCMTMGPYLLGLGLGSAMGDRINSERRLKFVWNVEWLSVVALPLIPLLQLLVVFFFLQFSPPGTKLDGLMGLQFLLGTNALLSLFTGVLGGAQLPLILKTKTGFSEEAILAVNYLGPLFAGFLIVGMAQAAQPLAIQIYVIGLVQLMGLLSLVKLFPNRKRNMVLLTVPLAVLFGAARLSTDVEELTVKSAYLGMKTRPLDFLNPMPIINVLRKYGIVERVKTPYQTIDLFIEPPETNYSIPGNASIYLNRKPQFDLFSVDLYHQSMVYGALNLSQGTPKNILILGAGDGLLLKELRTIKQIEQVTMIELDEKMLEWSRTNGVVSQLNEGSLEQFPANTKLIVGDGVSFLRNHRGAAFDLILIDFPFPNGHDLAKLYSFEFYTLVQRALSPTGLVVLDLPLYLDETGKLSHESRVILKTMKTAGLERPFLFGPSASFVAVANDKRLLAFDYSAFPANLVLSTYLNFLNPYREEDIPQTEWNSIGVNTMFWPRGL